MSARGGKGTDQRDELATFYFHFSFRTYESGLMPPSIIGIA
jgi:hypothetical protein